MTRLTWWIAAWVIGAAAYVAFGWDAHGHRITTLAALDGLTPDAPSLLRDPITRDRIAYQSTEPDHWRGLRSAILSHENAPDHYIDLELLAQFGLTFESLPRFRYEYLRAMGVAKHVHPEGVDPYDPAGDWDRTKEWPGFLPYAIGEHYAKLRSSFQTLRILERIAATEGGGSATRRAQLQQARDNVVYHMGVLSHFVTDAAQPLHTTKHFNGWVGDNPRGFTTDKGFHAYIDGGVLELHRIDYEALRPAVRFDRPEHALPHADDPWEACRQHIQRSFDRMVPLYEMEQDGRLRTAEGRAFILERLADGSAMLGALYNGAWATSEPTDEQVRRYLFFDGFNPAPADASPAGVPAPGSPKP